MIGISSKSPQLTNPEMEDRGSARSYNRSVEDLIRFFTSRKTAKANHTAKPWSLRQDSNVTGIRTLERKTSINLTSGLDSTCKTGVWNEYDQALLDLSRMIDDELTTTRMEQSLETINSRPQHLANQPTTNLNKIQLRRLWSSSSSVHPRSINSTPPSLERPIDSLPTSPVETNPFEPSEGQGSSYPRKPPIPPRAPTRPATPYSPSFDPKAKTTPPSQQPSGSSIPSLLVEAKTSNITRQLLSVTEFPQDRDGMRDSGVGIWTEEEICFVRAGIAFADGVGE